MSNNAPKSDAEDLSFHSGHRERLRQKFLDNNLADYELLELLLSFVIPRRDVRPLARGLMKKFGGIYPILSAPIDKLTEFRGIGRNTAIFIKTVHKIMLQGYKCELETQKVFHNERALLNYCLLLLGGKSKEESHVLYLGPDYRLLADDLHSVGTNDWAAIYPREILKRALELNALSVLLVHNHPTPLTTFSTEDIKLTADVQSLLNSGDIRLHDHYLVSGGIVYSARNMFLLK
ncbi:MAG: RadC family protein [Proteobacteria bacterium]|uniref:RadC family protein n=1 Tax=Candidatus Enterousia excrementavium TaxID=2840789 RepID=A0A940IBX0_9PROT|nr:RadC family protein [Candidatus Enterousia excrementavium]